MAGIERVLPSLGDGPSRFHATHRDETAHANDRQYAHVGADTISQTQ